MLHNFVTFIHQTKHRVKPIKLTTGTENAQLSQPLSIKVLKLGNAINVWIWIGLLRHCCMRNCRIEPRQLNKLICSLNQHSHPALLHENEKSIEFKARYEIINSENESHESQQKDLNCGWWITHGDECYSFSSSRLLPFLRFIAPSNELFFHAQIFIFLSFSPSSSARANARNKKRINGFYDKVI